MPTIEVDESDQVFVVKGRTGRGGYHEFGPSDLIIAVQSLRSVIDEVGFEDPGVPENDIYTRVWIGGTYWGGWGGFTLTNLGGPRNTHVEFTFQRGQAPVLQERILGLGPWATIRYLGDPTGSSEPPVEEPLTPVDRVSRYNRDPVI